MSEHELPHFEEASQPGARLVRRAVGLTLSGIALVVILSAGSLFVFSFDLTVRTAGVLEPIDLTRVYCQTSGIFEEVLVETGDWVEAGQLLARLDDFDLSSRLEQYRLDLKFKKYNGRAARGELEMLESKIDLAQRELERLEIRSPSPGQLLTEDVDKMIGKRAMEGEMVFEVGSPFEWKAVLSVPAAEVHGIELGDPVKTKVTAFAALRGWLQDGFPGEVIYVGTSPIENAASARGTYRLHASVDTEGLDPEELLRFRRGMTLDSQIVTRSGRGIDLLVRYLKKQVRSKE